MKSEAQSLAVRAKLTLRNEKMLKAREAKQWTQRKAAEAASVSLETYMNLEKLDFSRLGKNWMEHITRIAVALGITTDDVAPEAMIGQRVNSTQTVVKHLPVQAMLKAAEATQRRLLLPSPDEAAPCNDGLADLRNFLPLLPERERFVLSQRYGFNEHNERQTYDEIGEVLGLKKERVRQIEREALLKMREIMLKAIKRDAQLKQRILDADGMNGFLIDTSLSMPDEETMDDCRYHC